MGIMLRMRAFPAGFIAPCLPTKTDKLPSGDLWLHEIKHDGFTRHFPLIAEALKREGGKRQRWYDRFDGTEVLHQ
jgi:ATP-dependent DNA ligase